MQPTMETTIKTMRSLLNTSKNGLLEKQLRRDYRDMEGCEIPYKSFGYSTLLDFLRASDEFDLYSTTDGMQIRARVSQNSQHIVDLVGSQNRDRRKKSTKSMPFIPRFNSNANRRPTTVNGRPMSQQPQRRQQNGQYFANRNNTNNSSNRNNYSWNTSSAATSNAKQTYNENWDMDWNKLQHLAPALLNQIKQLQVQNAINFITQTQAQAQAQVLMQTSSGNVAMSTTSMSSKPQPIVSVNARLNPNFQSNQNSCSHDSTIPVETKSTLPTATGVTVTDRQWHKKDAQDEPSWDDEPSSVIDLTKSPQRTYVNGQKCTSNDEKWAHDRYDSNQPISKATTNVPPRLISANQTTSSRSALENATTLDQEKTISSSWLTFATNTTEPQTQKPISSRLESKVTNDRQPLNEIQTRLTAAEPPKPTIERQSDTVDYVMPDKQQQSNRNPFCAIMMPAIEQKIPSIATHDKTESKSQKSDEHSSKHSLAAYCQQKCWDVPEYECRRSRFKKFIGTVCVEGVKYSTEPFEYEDELRAENAAAAKALENFKEFPIARESSEAIAQKIYDCIGDNGVFLKYLSNIFEQKYEESLPDGWSKIIENRPEMFSIMKQATNLSIVFKRNMNAKSKLPTVEVKIQPTTESPVPTIATVNRNDAHVHENSVVEKTISNDANELPAMRLPWDKPYWRIKVTTAKSTSDIWGCNLDSADGDDLDDALVCVENEFMSDSMRPQPLRVHEIKDGHLYLVVHTVPNVEMPDQFNYYAYRVRVEECDRTQKRALCFYIDDGCTEWLDCQTNFFALHPTLLEYSAQAIHFSLYNVDVVDGNSCACEESSLLSNKHFVATVKTTKAQFEKQLERLDSDAVIPVILYDTSSDEDRNVNKDILQKIFARMEPPQLNPRASNIVDITHVCENGDVYCRLRDNKEMQLIERILKQITTTIDIEAYRVVPAQLQMKTNGKSKLYLIHDRNGDGRFYRAIILPNEASRPQPLCRCVDYGFNKRIPLDDIYNLERLRLAMSSYPHQTILVQLNGIESEVYTADSIERMREMLMCNKPIHLDVVVQSEWPIVELWKTNDDGILEALNGEIQSTLKVSGDCILHPEPKMGVLYEATVTTALNPSLFYVRFTTNDSTYNKMINSLWKDCENDVTILSKNQVKLNHLYGGRLCDGYWHRVKVQAFPTIQTVAVEKWDFGGIDHLSLDALRPLSETYLNVHQMVFCARLHDLQPRHNFWAKDDCVRFQELTVGKTFMVEIKQILRVADDSYVAELILKAPNDINISDVLVLEHRAI